MISVIRAFSSVVNLPDRFLTSIAHVTYATTPCMSSAVLGLLEPWLLETALRVLDLANEVVVECA